MRAPRRTGACCAAARTGRDRSRITAKPELARKIARLQRKLGKLFPDLDTDAAFSWAASFGETATGLPTIGEIPGHRNCWVALGYGGNGITYSRIAAEIIRTALTGGRDPDADLYAFKEGDVVRRPAAEMRWPEGRRSRRACR